MQYSTLVLSSPNLFLNSSSRCFHSPPPLPSVSDKRRRRSFINQRANHMALRFPTHHHLQLVGSPTLSHSLPTLPHRRRSLRCSAAAESPDTNKLILEVKRKLETEYRSLQTGPNGRDDDDMILWFLKDRKFSVEDAVAKLAKAIKWREDFGVSALTDESVKSLYETRKAYVHDFLDKNGRPVLVVVAAKHFPEKQDSSENEKLCVLMIEKALSKLPPGVDEILVILDLRGFGLENGDVGFLKFLIDVFYCYYPRRLGEILLVDAPLVFQPIWQLIKPLLRSYSSLVRFCNTETVRMEYFMESTVPEDFEV